MCVPHGESEVWSESSAALVQIAAGQSGDAGRLEQEAGLLILAAGSGRTVSYHTYEDLCMCCTNFDFFFSQAGGIKRISGFFVCFFCALKRRHANIKSAELRFFFSALCFVFPLDTSCSVPGSIAGENKCWNSKFFQPRQNESKATVAFMQASVYKLLKGPN